jgi:hypothetical protein
MAQGPRGAIGDRRLKRLIFGLRYWDRTSGACRETEAPYQQLNGVRSQRAYAHRRKTDLIWLAGGALWFAAGRVSREIEMMVRGSEDL